MNIHVELNEKQVKALKAYRKFLNRTRGTSYENLQEMANALTKLYLVSLSEQMRQMRREKVSKAYRSASQAKQDQVDTILGVPYDDE